MVDAGEVCVCVGGGGGGGMEDELEQRGVEFYSTPLWLERKRSGKYTANGGLNVTNQISRKLEVLDRKLEGSHSIFLWYLGIC